MIQNLGTCQSQCLKFDLIEAISCPKSRGDVEKNQMLNHNRYKNMKKRMFSKWATYCFIFLATLYTNGAVECACNYAIIGGQHNTVTPYAALVATDGTTTPLSGSALPVGMGEIRSVAINALGSAAIIGGTDSNGPYVVLVAPNGTTTPLSGPALPVGTGTIDSVAINSSGSAIIGGRDNGSTTPYTALVSPSGTTTALSGPGLPVGNGVIQSVAINDSGSAIFGGQANGGAPYAALVAPTGATTALSGPDSPIGFGAISSVSINSSGAAIIGGIDNGSSEPYAVLVSPSGTRTALSGPALPVGNGSIQSVAINDSGVAIIGGHHNGNLFPYTAFVSPSGTTTALSGPALPTGNGIIYSVAINSSGSAIIGGYDNGFATPYAALVSPSGTTTALSGSPLPTGNGIIFSVAINESGSAIIGGRDNGNTAPYVALVAPNGTITALSGSALPAGSGGINSVAIGSCGSTSSILNAVDPKSFGPGNCYSDPIFTLSTLILSHHLSQSIQYYPSEFTKQKEELSLVADTSDKIHCPTETNKPKFAIWISPFGLNAHYKEDSDFPSLRDRSVGGMLGFDYTGWDQGIIGGGLAYSFQNIHYSKSFGKSKIHQELATVYGAWRGPYVNIEGALWGGIYQMDNDRKTLGFISSKSSVHGGLFSPHLGINKPVDLKSTIITPFLTLDWVNNWQSKVREQGGSGFNLRLGSHYTSLLRTELGLRFIQHREVSKGICQFEEGISYVNTTPFNARGVSTYYVGSISSFNIQLFSNKTQNLGALFLASSFIPHSIKVPLITIKYQGQWGKNLSFNALALEIKKRF